MRRVLTADDDSLELLIEVQDRRIHGMRDLIGSGFGGHELRSERAIRRKLVDALETLRDAPWRARPLTAYEFDDVDELRAEVKMMRALAETIAREKSGLRLRNAVMIAIEDAHPGRYRQRAWRERVDYYTRLVETTARSRSINAALRILISDRLDVIRLHESFAKPEAAEMLASDGPSDAPTLADYLGDRKCLACGAQIEPTAHARRRYCSDRCAGRYGYHRRKNQRRNSEPRE